MRSDEHPPLGGANCRCDCDGYRPDTFGSDYPRKNIAPEKTRELDSLYSEPPTAVYKADGPPKHFMIGS